MKITFKKTPIIATIFAVLGSSCHTTAQAQIVPAILQSADENTMQTLKAALAESMKTSKVELGASDPTRSPALSVLPKSVVGLRGGNYANYALPTQFDIFMEGQSCYLVKRGTDRKIMLNGVACRPYSKN